MLAVRSTDGARIAVYDPNPRGRCPVLMIHGWPLSHEMFEYQVNLLLERGIRAVTLDLRGFGRSDMPAGGYGYDQMARDVLQVVRALNLAPFTLVGFSMGGAVALRYMRVCRGFGVTKLMLLAAAAPSFVRRPDFPYGLPYEEAEEYIRLAATDRPQLAENFSRSIFASPHSPAAVQWFRDIALSASGWGTIRTAVSLRDEDGRADLASVHVPTAVFQADKDKIVLRGLTEYQAAHIPGAKLIRFRNSGHGIVYDELARFNAAFLEFLEA